MTPVKQVSPDMPWLMEPVIEWLDRVVLALHSRVILETGAGGSTVFFARRCFRLITYEHDPVWASTVRTNIARERMEVWNRVEFREWPLYPQVGLGGLVPQLDLAFIDGRGRVRSVMDALPCLKPGGWLVLDDAGRERYAEARQAMDAACSARIEFRSPPWEPEQWTTAWRKR